MRMAGVLPKEASREMGSKTKVTKAGVVFHHTFILVPTKALLEEFRGNNGNS